jgi:2'-phosphotransferase
MARGDRRGGGGSGLSREVQVSKKLSWLLRHGAEKEGLELGPGGYVNVQEVVCSSTLVKYLMSPNCMNTSIHLLNLITKHLQLNSRGIHSLKVTFAEIQEIVASNDKQRFSLVPITEAPGDTPSEASTIDIDDTNPTHFLIRANQGHTLKVDVVDLLTPITSENAPALIVHGTTRRAWPLIVSSGGLKPMGRNHVHFATGLPAGFKRLVEAGIEGEEKSPPVISGMRSSSSVLIFVDLKKAMEMGLQFWISENGVVLCDGGENGIIPIEYFESVEERGGSGTVLIKDGVVQADLGGRTRRS